MKIIKTFKGFTNFIFAISMLFCHLSCQDKSHSKVNSKKQDSYSNITLSIEKEGNPFGTSSSPLNYVDSEQESFSGIVFPDSSFVFKYSKASENQLNKLKTKNVESDLQENLKEVFVLSGIHNGKQFLIIDRSRNKDFGDDVVIEFNPRDPFNKDFKSSFIVESFDILDTGDNNLGIKKAYLKFYPDPTYLTYSNESESEKLKHQLQIVAADYGYQLGEFEIGHQPFEVSVKKGLFGHQIRFKEKNVKFLNYGEAGFKEYRLKDTVNLGNKYFKIDTITSFPPKLKLSQIEFLETDAGFRVGSKSNNFSVQHLDGSITDLKSLANEKGFVLLDFWGTWCQPCKELTPELKNLHNEYGDQISFVSLAYELEADPVKKYVSENEMNWYQGFIMGKPKSRKIESRMIKELRVECFPTFLVLDKDLNILFRTCGGGAYFKSLKQYLDKEFDN